MKTKWARKCSEPGCDKHLRAQNKSGRCWICNSNLASKNYQKNNREKIRFNQRNNYFKNKIEKMKNENTK
ncbi:hypothetical protein KAI04_04315 [Candidatus Pacearchaeota archaeon]|nr:hypothetical protein [Candidatus Pacearchaeota archaeon]